MVEVVLPVRLRHEQALESRFVPMLFHSEGVGPGFCVARFLKVAGRGVTVVVRSKVDVVPTVSVIAYGTVVVDVVVSSSV